MGARRSSSTVGRQRIRRGGGWAVAARGAGAAYQNSRFGTKRPSGPQHARPPAVSTLPARLADPPPGTRPTEPGMRRASPCAAAGQPEPSTSVTRNRGAPYAGDQKPAVARNGMRTAIRPREGKEGR